MTEHKNLTEALCAVQATVGTLPKDGTNPHFRSRFTPLDTIVEKVGPVLAEHGLTWSTFPCFGPNGEPALRYKLSHVSGDSESDTMPLLVQKPDPQGQGSAITYGRRYSICAVLNLVADEDDDGNAASPRTQASGRAANGNGTVVTDGDVAALHAAAKGLAVAQIKLAMTSVGVNPPDPFVPAEAFNRVPQAKSSALAQALSGVPRAGAPA